MEVSEPRLVQSGAPLSPAAEDSSGFLSGRQWRFHRHFIPYLDVSGFPQQKRTDDKRNAGHHHRIPKSRADVAGGGNRRQADQRLQTAEYAVANMVGKRQRSVSDPCREGLDQVGSDWPIRHSEKDQRDEYQ